MGIANFSLQGSKGNTPLHYACLLERTKHAELLLEYGALPDARNEHGQRPLDLVPRDAVRSTKLYFKRIFDVRNTPFLAYFLPLCATAVFAMVWHASRYLCMETAPKRVRS